MVFGALTGCPSTTGGDSPSANDYTEVVVFDPAATDSYKVYATFEDGDFTDELTLDEDYSVEDGMLKVTPDGWNGAWIVLNEEIDCTGGVKAAGSLKASKTGSMNMGLNVMNGQDGQNCDANFLADAATTETAVESAFGKKFTGTDWSTGTAVSYDGAEVVKCFQPYGQSTTDWNATSDVDIYVGKITVYVPTVVTPEPEYPEVTLPEGALDLTPFSDWGWGWSADFDKSTKTITLTGADGALSNGANPAADWSDYESMTVVVYNMSEAYVKLCIASSDWGTSCQTEYKSAISNEATEITLDFGDLDSENVSQWMIQGSSEGETITVLAAWLNPAE